MQIANQLGATKPSEKGHHNTCNDTVIDERLHAATTRTQSDAAHRGAREAEVRQTITEQLAHLTGAVQMKTNLGRRDGRTDRRRRRRRMDEGTDGRTDERTEDDDETDTTGRTRGDGRTDGHDGTHARQGTIMPHCCVYIQYGVQRPIVQALLGENIIYMYINIYICV